jgi:pyruvate ferredoxin oxidoreductase beta subunit/2-oxoisovalerate ferredoxin oxidoreductase beta subunit
LELMDPGTLGCQGCGGALSMRLVLKEVGDDAIAVVPACCWSIIDGPWPLHALKIPVFHTAFETAAVVAAGIKAAKVRQGRDTTVIAWAGDGGTFDIGLQALSGAAERNEDIIYVCYDNEAYMNTGIQRSSATPFGAWTTTTPARRGIRRRTSWPSRLGIYPVRGHRHARLSNRPAGEGAQGEGRARHTLPAHPLALPPGLEGRG